MWIIRIGATDAHIRTYSPYSEKEVDLIFDFTYSLTQPEVETRPARAERFDWVRKVTEEALGRVLSIEGVNQRGDWKPNPLLSGVRGKG
jgi:hypothetical protein